MRRKILSILLVTLVLATLLVGCAGVELSVKRPTDGAILTQSLIEVSGSVSGPAEVTVNGEPVELSIYKTFNASIDLVEGKNTITITATEGKEVITKVITVTYQPN